MLTVEDVSKTLKISPKATKMEEGLQKLHQNDMKITQKIRRMRITL